MNDARAILKAAGVECAEVDRWDGWVNEDGRAMISEVARDYQARAAILALAGLVAEHKERADKLRDAYLEVTSDTLRALHKLGPR